MTWWVPAASSSGREGVQVGEPRPGDGGHLHGSVELHRARPERDHGPVEGDVAVGQTAQLAHHRGLGPVAVEHRVGQHVRGPSCARGQGIGFVVAEGDEVLDRARPPERAQHRDQVVRGRGLVQGDRHDLAVDPQQVAGLPCPGGHACGVSRHPEADRVEEVVVDQGVPGRPCRRGQRDRRAVDPPGDPSQALGPVVLAVQGGHDGQQHLGGADVRGRPLAADVLLAGLQRQPVGRAALRVHRDADQAPRQRATIGFTHGDERRVGAAVHHRDTEALGRAHDDVGTLLARGPHEQAREQVGGDDDPHVAVVQPRDDVAVVVQRPRRRRLLQQHREGALGDLVGPPVPHRHVHPEGLGAGPHHRQGLRVHVVVDGEDLPCGSLGPVAQRHRLGRRGALVQQRGVGDVHAGQVADHRLEVEQHLEPALRDLGLVRRVGRVPGRVLEDVALDHGRGDRPVVAEPQVGPQRTVACGQVLQLAQHPVLRRGRGHRVEGVVADGRRHGLVEELGHGATAEVAQHARSVVGVRAHVARHEPAVVLQVGEGGRGHATTFRGIGATTIRGHRTTPRGRRPTSCACRPATARTAPPPRGGGAGGAGSWGVSASAARPARPGRAR